MHSHHLHDCVHEMPNKAHSSSFTKLLGKGGVETLSPRLASAWNSLSDAAVRGVRQNEAMGCAAGRWRGTSYHSNVHAGTLSHVRVVGVQVSSSNLPGSPGARRHSVSQTPSNARDGAVACIML